MAHRGWILAAMGAAIGMILLDETAVGVALDTIGTDLDLSSTQSHWVVNSYLLVLASFVVVGGKVADRYGYERVFIVGGVIFGVASAAAGFAPSGLLLVLARTVQGFGAAAMFPVSLSMVTIAYPGKRRAWALGVYSAIGTAFMMAGPLIGGIFTEALSWRWIFWVNPIVMLGALAIVIAMWREPERTGVQPPIDSVGAVLLVSGLSGIVLALMQGGVWGWTSIATVACFTLGAAALIAFWFVEERVTHPLVDVRNFRNGSFFASNLAIFDAQFTKGAEIVFLPLYLQQVVGFSAFYAGLGLLPAMLVAPFASIVAGRATDRRGPRVPILLGLIGVSLGMAWIAGWTGIETYWILIPGIALTGWAATSLFPPGRHGVMGALPTAAQGEGGGISMQSQMVGGTLGIAVMSALQVSGASWVAVFMTPVVLSAAVFAAAWFAFPRANATTPSDPPRSPHVDVVRDI